MFKPLDDRQVENRTILQELVPYSSDQGLDVLMASINSDLTPPLKVDAQNPATLTINIGPGIVPNAESSRNKSISFINNVMPVFTGGTVTFPSTSGGNITTSTGGTYILTLPSGDFVQVLLYLDQNSNINAAIGTPNATLSLATVPNSISNTLPFAYVTLHNIAGTIQNVAQDAIFYIAGGGGSGGGMGGINYILNSDAEASTVDWNLYKNTAANIPSTGSGGSPTGLTFTRSTTAPLIGLASFILEQANSTNDQGEGVSTDFTIDSAYQANVLSISFNYNASSTFVASDGSPPLNDGTTSTNTGNSDVEVFIYDITNAALIYVTPQVITANGANNFSFSGAFQTAPNSTHYRLILHVATANANAVGWSLKFDNVVVGPQTDGILVPAIPTVVEAADTSVYTLANTINTWQLVTSGWNIVIPSTGYWKLSYKTAVVIEASSGSPNTALALSTSTTPGSGLIEGNVVATAQSPNQNITGAYLQTKPYFLTAGTTIYLQAQVMQYLTSSSVSNFEVVNNAPGEDADFGSASYIRAELVPNFASGTNDGDIIAARYFGCTSSISNSPQVMVYDTIDFDSTGSYNTSTGIYTVPTSGSYHIDATVDVAATYSFSNDLYIAVYRNGTQIFAHDLNETTTGTYALTISVSGLVGCVAGDQITIQANTNASTPTLVSNNFLNTFSIFKLSGTAQNTLSDSVNASYGCSTNTPIGVGITLIPFNTLYYDTHNTFNISTSLYTIPVSGKYNIESLLTLSVGLSPGDNVVLQLSKNGIAYRQLGAITAGASGIFDYRIGGSTGVACIAGDTLSIFLSSNSTGTLDGGVIDNHFSVNRIGN